MTPNRCVDCETEIGAKAKRCRVCQGKHAAKTRKPPATARCGGKKRNGEPCQHSAGFRTDHPGFGPCWLHLGNAPAQRAQAGREMVAAEMRTLGVPVKDVTPHSAITGLLRQSAGLVAALTIELEAQGDLRSEESRGSFMIFNSERDRLARFAKIAADIGVEERAIKLAEAHTKILSDFVERVFNRLDLDPEQRKALGQVIREEAATLNGNATEVDAPD